LVTAMWIDVIDDIRGADHAMFVTLDAQGMIVQKCRAFRAPALRSIERAGDRISLTLVVTVALTLLAPPNGTVDRWTDGQGKDLDGADDEYGDVRNDNARDGSSPSRALISRAYPESTSNKP